LSAVMPSCLAVTNSVFGTLQRLLLKGMSVVACMGCLTRVAKSRCDTAMITLLLFIYII
ncbi:hypothetical protein KIPB_013007, partial [Kipferlia bialata]